MHGDDSLGDGSGGDDICTMFSFSVQRLAGISSRIALLEIKPRFGLTLLDWRALAVLDYLGDASVQALAHAVGVQKSQMSRSTAALESRGLMSRRENPEDGRSSLLRLTDEGRRIVSQVLSAARQRNDAMLDRLTEAERRQLMALLAKATEGSLELLAALKAGERPE